MEDRKQLRRTFFPLILATIMIILCYYLVDKPVAFWMSQLDIKSLKVLILFSKLPDIFVIAALVCFCFSVLRNFFDRPTGFDQRLLTFAYTIAIAFLLKVFFKFLFGRYWPETWCNNNPSLIKDSVYGFNFFNYEPVLGAFPSGHATLLFAGISFLWLQYPRWWLLYVVIISINIASLLFLNYHFVSDLVAGAALGYFVAKVMTSTASKQ